MHLLITGGAGYIGSIVAERAIDSGFRVTVVDDLSEGHAAAVHPAARFVSADAGDGPVLDSLLSESRIDAVVHLAAETTIAVSMTDPARYFRNNVGTTLAVLEGMRRHGVPRLVFSSTAAVYGESDSAAFIEGDHLQPINAYGESKLMCERMIEWYCRAYGMAAVAFRYFNAAGASDERGEAHRHETHLIPMALGAARNGGALKVYGHDYPTPDGSCIRDFVHVLDIADAHLAALRRLDEPGFTPFNIGTGRGHSVLEVVNCVREVTGLPLTVEGSLRRQGDPAILVANGARAAESLGWAPRRSSLTEILHSAWRWTLKHPTGYEPDGHA